MIGLAPDRRFVALLALLLSVAACSATPQQGPADTAAEGSSSGGATDAGASADGADATASDANNVDSVNDISDPSDAPADSASSPDGSADAEGSDVAAEETTPPEQLGPWVEIGQGEGAFEGVAESSEVTCIFGPQGSYHVWAAIRLHNIPPLAIRVDTFADIGGTQLGVGSATPLNSEWTLNPDGTADIFGQFLYLDFGIDFPALSDRPVTLRATVRSDSIHMVSASATGRFLCIQ
ncbi:MAG: hypothetical protein HQ461_08500 [Deltaproteobacteria bacterium]|nr:hypothetical protein [Deltaproteobacteria bacterium]